MGDCEEKVLTHLIVSRFRSLVRNGAKCSKRMALKALTSISEKAVSLSQGLYPVLKVRLRIVLTKELTVEDEVESDFISMICLREQLCASDLMLVSEKIRGVIRCRKVLETVRNDRRACCGRCSKIEERISTGMNGIVDMIG